MRITAQLIEARTDSHLWSETYDRELENIFDVQDEISEAIVGALKESLNIQLETAPKTITATNTEAHDAYLRGRYLVVQRTTTTIEAAVREFEKAITLDPGYALAHAELAIAYLLALRLWRRDRYEAIASQCSISIGQWLWIRISPKPTLPTVFSCQKAQIGKMPYLPTISHPDKSQLFHRSYVEGNCPGNIGRYGEQAFLTCEATLRLDPLSNRRHTVYTQSLRDRNLLDNAAQELEKFASIIQVQYAPLRGYLTYV